MYAFNTTTTDTVTNDAKGMKEQEARISVLRQKAKDKLGQKERFIGPTLPPQLESRQEHINLFSDLEGGRRKDIVENEEHKLLKKKEQEEYEKKIGYLTYLGQSELGESGYQPVYKMPSLLKQAKTLPQSKSEKQKKDERLFDPMRFITNSLGISMKDKPKKIDSSMVKIESKVKKDKKEKKKKRKDKKRKRSSSSESEESKHKRKRKKRERSDSSDDEEEYEKRRKIAILREERLRREAVERERQEKALRTIKGIPDKLEKGIEPQIKRKYNSQFNPEIARQNQ
ncbi:leukocyte receptor cluster member 1 homolog [Artemia franciscana]|uniref:leukocyte receptor cluster member 1 homolog n=1 Tax=Artemia franciscana TaxID=6661 RepID=UPI0032DBDE84